MISFIVRLKFSQNDRSEVFGMLQALTSASRLEPGCVNYTSHTLDGDPDTVVIYEQWQDEKALDDHGKTSHFLKYAVGGLYQKMLERSREDLNAVL